MNSDHGNVEIVSASAFAGRDGPSIPEPVVQPLTEAALKTNPMASSYKSKFRRNYLILLETITSDRDRDFTFERV